MCMFHTRCEHQSGQECDAKKIASAIIKKTVFTAISTTYTQCMQITSTKKINAQY